MQKPDPFNGFWMVVTFILCVAMIVGLIAMLNNDNRAMAWIAYMVPVWILASIRARMDKPAA